MISKQKTHSSLDLFCIIRSRDTVPRGGGARVGGREAGRLVSAAARCAGILDELGAGHACRCRLRAGRLVLFPALRAHRGHSSSKVASCLQVEADGELLSLLAARKARSQERHKG